MTFSPWPTNRTSLLLATRPAPALVGEAVEFGILVGGDEKSSPVLAENAVAVRHLLGAGLRREQFFLTGWS
jgi:hypothetical protein